jgi:hypothetical protein
LTGTIGIREIIEKLVDGKYKQFLSSAALFIPGPTLPFTGGATAEAKDDVAATREGV